MPGMDLNQRVEYILLALANDKMERAEIETVMSAPHYKPFWDSLAGTTQHLGDILYHGRKKGLIAGENLTSRRVLYWNPEASKATPEPIQEPVPGDEELHTGLHNVVESALQPLEGLSLPIDRSMIPLPSYAALYPFVIQAIEKLGGEAECAAIRVELGLDPYEVVVGEGMRFSWAMAEMRDLGYVHTIDHPTKGNCRLYKKGDMTPDPAEPHTYKQRETGGEAAPPPIAATVPVAPRPAPSYSVEDVLERAERAAKLHKEHEKAAEAIRAAEQQIEGFDALIEERGIKISDGTKRAHALQQELDALRSSLTTLRQEDDFQRQEREKLERALKAHRDRLEVATAQLAELFGATSAPSDWTDELPPADNVIHLVRNGRWLQDYWVNPIINYLLKFQLHGKNEKIGDIHEKVKGYLRKRAEEMNPSLVRDGMERRKFTTWDHNEVQKYGVPIMWEIEDKLFAKFGHRYAYTHYYLETKRKFAQAQAEAVEKHQAAGTAE